MPKSLSDSVREEIDRLQVKKVRLEQQLVLLSKKLKLLEDTAYSLDQYTGEEADIG